MESWIVCLTRERKQSMHARIFSWLVVLAVGLLAPEPAPAAPDDTELADAQQTLREARVSVDGPSLVKFFRQRTLPQADRDKLAATVRRLGDDAFAVRRQAYKDLLLAGRASLPFLRPAVKDDDPQIARSAEELLGRIEAGADVALTIAAARVLAARKPPGAAEALLAYLPLADEESLQEAVLETLAAVGLRQGRVDPVLTAALKDSDPVHRLGAAFVHGKGGPDARKALKTLLADSDARVRYQVAAALLRAGDRSAMPVLIALLVEARDPVPGQVEEILGQLAGDQGPTVALGTTDEERRKCRVEWDQWWKPNGARVDLAKLNQEKALRGLNLVCECGAGRNPQGFVWEFGRDGKRRWEFNNVNTPCDVQPLPGKRVLVCNYHGNEVTERDHTGKVLWTYRTTGSVRSCRRLANGNTFIATINELLEVKRDGTKVYSHSRQGNIYRARKLANGHFLYVNSQGQVVELDRSGKDVRTVAIPGGTGVFADVDLLPGGRYLVGLYSANKVMELDRAGKVLSQFTVTTPSSVNRLPSGHVLVTSMDAKCVVEFTRQGKEVWKQTTPGRPFCVRRY
jgi:HEAT repeat protein